MKVVLLVIGKTNESYLEEGIKKYLERLKHYISFSIDVIPELKNVKNVSREQQMEREAELVEKKIGNDCFLILMDEKGKHFSWEQFASELQKLFNKGKDIYFVVGGPYGFDPKLKQKANMLLSLSNMTFSHQMVRLFFVEQIYRAMTILRNEPYHHS